MAVTSTPRMVTDGLILYLDPSNPKSYPGTGTGYYDLTQNDYTASLINGVAFSSEKNGILRFDGTNDYILISDNTRLRFPTAWTISYWIRIGKVLWTFGDQIISKRIDGQTVNYQTYVNSGSTVSTPNGYSIGFGGNTGGSWWGVGLSGSAQELAYNEWYHVTGRYSSSRVDIFVNGGIVTGSSGLPALATSTAPVNISGYTAGVNPFSGSMGNIWIYNRALSDIEIFKLYETTREKYNFPETMTDEDAVNFINAAQLRTDTQRKAINDLVVDMKNAGIWSKMKAIYPFVGGTAASHKWNLKDPRDVDAAFRLSFIGGWTHSSSGATPNGTNGYADTFITPTTHLTQDSTHLSFYSRTNQFEVGVEMGVYNSTTSPAGLHTLQVGSLADGVDPYQSYTSYSTSDFAALFYPQNTTVTTLGMYIGTRTSGTYSRLFRNNEAIATDTTSTAGWSAGNLKIFIGNRNANGSPDAGQYSVKQCAFSSIGDGLTDTDAANLYTIVQKYQTTLGRQV